MSDYDLSEALQVSCPSPLDKLVYMVVANRRPRDQGGGEHKSPFVVERDTLAELCCCDREAAINAVKDLHEFGYFELVSYSSSKILVRFLRRNDEFEDPECLGVPYDPDLDAPDPEPEGPRPPWLTGGHRRRAKLWAKQKGYCWYCGCRLAVHEEHWERSDTRGLHNGWKPIEGYSNPMIEHQRPRSRGGPDAKQNTVLSCGLCNSRKSDRTIEEYRDLCALKGWQQPVVFHGEKLELAEMTGGDQ